MATINITYDEIAPLLKTGDIVLYEGNSSFQKVIDVITGSPYNHMSMVVLSKDIGLKEPTDEILLWESTPYAITVDKELDKPKAGPTLVSMKTRLEQEIDKDMFSVFVIRRLSGQLTAANLAALSNAIQAAYPDKFPTDFWFFVKGILGRLFNVEVPQATYFCSELIAYTYQKMGILSNTHPPDYYEPKDFSSAGKITLQQNLSFGDDYNLELALKA
jgi:hypothetical protein